MTIVIPTDDLSNAKLDDLVAQRDAALTRVKELEAVDVPLWRGRAEAAEEKLRQYRAAFILMAHDHAFPWMLAERRKQLGKQYPPDSPILFCANDGSELVSISLLCSDTFGYACADAEEIPLSECPALVELMLREGWAGLVRWIQERRAGRGQIEKPILPVAEAMQRQDDLAAQRDAALARLAKLSDAARRLIEAAGFGDGEAVVDARLVVELAIARIDTTPRGE